MSDKAETPAEGAAAAPAKSKKMVVIIGAVVLAVVLGAVAFVMMQKKKAAEAEEGDEEVTEEAAHDHPTGPPVYLALDNMVVNLADPGGERVAQVGITLEVGDAKAADTIKLYLPGIRSGVLLLVAQRTSEELLSAEGKQKLADDILNEVMKPFGGMPSKEKKPKKKAKKEQEEAPKVYRVLFSSFIVQ